MICKSWEWKFHSGRMNVPCNEEACQGKKKEKWGFWAKMTGWRTEMSGAEKDLTDFCYALPECCPCFLSGVDV